MKPTNEWIKKWAEQILEPDDDCGSFECVVEKIVAAVTEEHEKALDWLWSHNEQQDLRDAAIDAIRSWTGEEEE